MSSPAVGVLPPANPEVRKIVILFHQALLICTGGEEKSKGNSLGVNRSQHVTEILVLSSKDVPLSRDYMYVFCVLALSLSTADIIVIDRVCPANLCQSIRATDATVCNGLSRDSHAGLKPFSSPFDC